VNPVTGLWGFRASGSTAYAMSFEKASEIAKKVTGYHEVPPAGFTAFGHPSSAAKKAETRPVAPVVVAAPVKKDDADCDAGPGRRRTVGQARAWLKVCENNLTRCETGEIGGDVEKYRKSVETARKTLADAEAATASVGSDNDVSN